jgi:alkanesulfonate monooxygenase SsuD/methylene tetrahydromethanopterin reductase-like flavin-dependent oxidoreductase (luciferase family)
LGLGAGWMEREHKAWGWELLAIPDRFERFEDGLKIITQLMTSERPVSYKGKYYQVNDALMLPRPARPGGPPILIGGTGPKFTLPLVAKYADEWNCLGRPPETFSELSHLLDEMIEKNERQTTDIRRSMMAATEYGQNEQDLAQRVRERFGDEYNAEDLVAHGLIVGTGNQIVDQLGALAEAGLQRVMLQWLDLDGIDRLEDMAAKILPQL